MISFNQALYSYNSIRDRLRETEESVSQFEKGELSSKWGPILLEDLEGYKLTLEKADEVFRRGLQERSISDYNFFDEKGDKIFTNLQRTLSNMKISTNIYSLRNRIESMMS